MIVGRYLKWVDTYESERTGAAWWYTPNNLSSCIANVATGRRAWELLVFWADPARATKEISLETREDLDSTMAEVWHWQQAVAAGCD